MERQHRRGDHHHQADEEADRAGGPLVHPLGQPGSERAAEVTGEPRAQADQRNRAGEPYRLVHVEQVLAVAVDQDDAHHQRQQQGRAASRGFCLLAQPSRACGSQLRHRPYREASPVGTAEDAHLGELTRVGLFLVVR